MEKKKISKKNEINDEKNIENNDDLENTIVVEQEMIDDIKAQKENLDFKNNEILPEDQEIIKENEKNEENQTKLYIIFAIILIVVIGAIVFFLLTEMNKKDSNSKDNNDDKPTNYVDDGYQYDDDDIVHANAEVWNGTYVNGNTKIMIYKVADKMVTVGIIGNSYTYIDINIDDEEKIIYNDDFLGASSSLIIEKTANGIKVTASSSDANSVLNNINGTYTKNQFKSKGWDGTYANGDVSVIISEIDQNSVICTITKVYSVASFPFDTISASELVYIDETDKDTVKVAKTENGIYINANSKQEDSLFNEITGGYTKQ